MNKPDPKYIERDEAFKAAFRRGDIFAMARLENNLGDVHFVKK